MGVLRLVVPDGMVLKDVCQLFLVHTHASIYDRQFYILFMVLGLDGDVTACLRELTGIVGQGVQHEECQHAVSLDLQVGRLYV